MNETITMQQLVDELKKQVPLGREWTREGDIVLIASLDPRMLAFAVVLGITRDESRRDEWYQVEMRLLTVPLQPLTWILRPEQMSGREIFTMGGKERFMAPLEIGRPLSAGSPGGGQREAGGGKKVVPLRRIK